VSSNLNAGPEPVHVPSKIQTSIRIAKLGEGDVQFLEPIDNATDVAALSWWSKESVEGNRLPTKIPEVRL
jgi:hypothetical protein